MQFGLDALLTMTVDIEAMLGLLLLFVWVQNTSIHAVAWWGFAYLLRACSIFLFGLYGTASDLITIDLGNALLLTSFALTWMGARVFVGRSVQPLAVVAGAVCWLFASRAPILIDSQNLRILFGASIITAYTWLAAYRALAWSQRAIVVTMANDPRIGCLRRTSFAAHPAQRNIDQAHGQSVICQ